MTPTPKRNEQTLKRPNKKTLSIGHLVARCLPRWMLGGVNDKRKRLLQKSICVGRSQYHLAVAGGCEAFLAVTSVDLCGSVV